MTSGGPFLRSPRRPSEGVALGTLMVPRWTLSNVLTGHPGDRGSAPWESLGYEALRKALERQR